MELGVAQGDGRVLLEHLQAAHRAGETDPRLAEMLEPMPALLRGIWHAYLDLESTMPEATPIAYSHLEAWERRHGVRLTAWEAETVIAMDQAALNVKHSKKAAP